MPGGVKGKERAGRNQRNHHQHKLLKSIPTLTHTHRYTVALETKSITSSLLWGSRTHSSAPRVAARRNPGPREACPLAAPPRPRSPGRIPRRGARQPRDRWSRRRNKTWVNWKDPCCGCCPGVAWDSLLSSGGAAAVGGSSVRGGPTSPRAAAPSTATPQDPGRRHLNQDGSRAGTHGARNPSVTGSGRRAAAGPRDLCCPAAARRPHDGSGAPVGGFRASRFSGPSGHFAPEPLRLW